MPASPRGRADARVALVMFDVAHANDIRCQSVRRKQTGAGFATACLGKSRFQ
jgi:hypothetical protein